MLLHDKEMLVDHVTLDPPRGAHPVEAPFKRDTVNEAITGTFLVEIATASPSPDVILHSTNGQINTSLYFQGGLPRHIGVQVSTTNGEIHLALPELQHAQHPDLRVESVNGAVRIALPESFKGYLRVDSVNGSINLGYSLERNSKLISEGSASSDKHRVYYITPSSSSSRDMLDEDNEKVHVNNTVAESAELEDNCQVGTTSGQIRVAYYDALEDEDEDEEGGFVQYAWNTQGNARNCCNVA